MRPALMGLVLALVQGAWLSVLPSDRQDKQNPGRPRAASRALPTSAAPPAGAGIQSSGAGAPAGWMAQVQQDLAAREYEISWQSSTAVEGIEAAWQAPNRAHGFRTYFTPEGIWIVPRDTQKASWRWGLSLAGYGQGGTAWEVGRATLSPSGKRIDYHRGTIEESYDNSPVGLEQRFTLSSKPERLETERDSAGASGWTTPLRPKPLASESVEDGEEPVPGGDHARDSASWVHLDLALWGDLHPRISEDGQAINFVTASGAPALHYAQMKVTDARGNVLPAWMEGFSGSKASGIRIVIDARDASYPITVDPLATSPAWTAESNQSNASFGWSVATAGDVNGDSYSDVVVGAPGYDHGQIDEGGAFVYLGTASGLSTTPAWTGESDAAGLAYGTSVATAGDVNGDGYSDVIVGSSTINTDFFALDRAYVYLGSLAGLALSPAWMGQASQTDSGYGFSVATAGDVNGDGYSDFLVGEPYWSNGESGEGRALLYLGAASGPSVAPAWSVESNQIAAQAGFSVATAGDVDGDGYADVLVGAPFLNDGRGASSLYRGSAAGLSASASWTQEGAQFNTYWGWSVATAGDVNGDGYADVLVGAPSFNNGQAFEGFAALFMGSAAGLAIAPAWSGEGDQSGANLGSSVATAGDVNGDGYADVLIAAPGYDNGQNDEGRAYVYLGSASGLVTTLFPWMIESDQAGARLGRSVATAGDVNGDGYADVVLGLPYYDNGQTDEGRAFLYLGSPSVPSTTPGWTGKSDQANARFGWSVATAGDVNGDGYADFLVGAPDYDNGYASAGRADLYLGSAAGLSLIPAWTAEGDQTIAEFGWSVATAGDVNRDGYSDVIVGAHFYSHGETGEGRAYLFLGSAAGLSSTAAWIAESDQASAEFGESVATAGDVNGDGYFDVLVVARQYTNGQFNEGRAFLYLGSASGLSTTATWTTESDQAEAYLAYVAAAGDVNGDGYSDVLVGAPNYDNGQTEEGRAYLYLGSASGLSTTAAWIAESDQTGAQFGSAVATAGDVNGDGYSDVLVGVPYYDNGQTDEGRTYLYLGSASGPALLPGWTGESDQANARFGWSVGTAGDVNGDGYADVLIGAPLFDNGQMDEGGAFLYLGSASGLSTAYPWTAESNQAGAFFGWSVATAGDVNGDGYADVLVGAAHGDLLGNAGAFLYYGNGGPGMSLNPRQRQSDFFGFQPVAPGGQSNVPGSFDLLINGRTPFGRSKVRLEWEVEPLGTLLGGPPMIDSSSTDTGTAGAILRGGTLGRDPGPYHWRLRLHYDSDKTPFAQHSRWMTIPWHGWQEAHLTLGAFLGGWVWDDLDQDGIRDGGEPGRGGATVKLLNSSGAVVEQKPTIGDGYYNFHLPGVASSFRIQYQPPAGTSLTLQNQGGDDTNDSDPDPASGLTPLVGPGFTYLDNSRWSAGLLCNAPTLPVSIGVRPVSGTPNLILDITDPNPASQVTGYNIYRANQPQPSPSPWTLLGANVVDNDPGMPNVQWTDTSGATPALGAVFYYQVTAFNQGCGSEGPR
jgi:hypothetical protein